MSAQGDELHDGKIWPADLVTRLRAAGMIWSEDQLAFIPDPEVWAIDPAVCGCVCSACSSCTGPVGS